MKAIGLAHAYVTLDRFVFYQLQKSSAFQSWCTWVKQRLKENEGLKDFKELCDMGAEGSELLWLLAGCEGLPGFAETSEVFGWSPTELRKGLASIERAAVVIEEMQRRPFGLLARYAGSGSVSSLCEDLRSYLALARDARSDFGHRSDWFLNIAKARLVIHVTHRTKGDPRDKQISGLIAAVANTDYNADAQRRWRHKHSDLIRTQLDPYTTMGQAARDQVAKSWDEFEALEPEFFSGFAEFTANYEALALSRGSKLPNHKSKKNTL